MGATAKARIVILFNNENECKSCDSRIEFGTGGYPDDFNTCGNDALARYDADNGNKHIKAMGYILVQWQENNKEENLLFVEVVYVSLLLKFLNCSCVLTWSFLIINTRFFAAGNFHVQRSRPNQLISSFSRSGVRKWNKIPLTLLEQRKDPFKRKLHGLLIKVLETKKVYVARYEYHLITSSYLNCLFS